MKNLIKSDKAKAKINKDIFYIKNYIKKNIPGIISVILIGSHSKGEGSVALSDGNLIATSDYDFVIVTNNKVGRDKLSLIEQELGNNLVVSRVDLYSFTKDDLKKCHPSIFHYDLKYSGRVLYGDQHILHLIPEIKAEHIESDKTEAFILQSWAFLGTFREQYLCEKPSGKDEILLRYYLAKVILFSSRQLLLSKGIYSHSVLERDGLFKKTFPEKQFKYAPIVEWALQQKLNPSLTNDFNLRETLFKARDFYFEAFLANSCKKYGQNFASIQEIIHYYRFNVKALLKHVYFFTRKNRDYRRRMFLDAAQLYLVLAYTENGVTPVMLSKANRLLGKAVGKNLANSTWDESRALSRLLRLTFLKQSMDNISITIGDYSPGNVKVLHPTQN